MLQQLSNDAQYRWHYALNDYNTIGGQHHSFMYQAKALSTEVPRLALLFEMERNDKLPKIHRQCSHSEPEQVIDNHLTCCLGVVCRECPHLRALDKADITPEERDTTKAWTCATHVLMSLELEGWSGIDTSEGYILTTDDRMYWDNVYASLAAVDVGDEQEEASGP